MKNANPGKAIRFTRGNPRKHIQPRPVLPTANETAILRRAAASYIFVTYTESGIKYRYSDGSPVTLRRSKIGTATWDDGEKVFAHMVKEGWLIPDKGDSLFEGGPAQVYRPRKLG